MQLARPVLLTALTAVLAFIPLTSSVFWGSMAYTLIGGTIGGTILIIVSLPALYSIWFKIVPQKKRNLLSIQGICQHLVWRRRISHDDNRSNRDWIRGTYAASPVSYKSFYGKLK